MDTPMNIEELITLHAEHPSTFSLAAQQNSYPLFRNLRLNYQTLDETSANLIPLRNLVIKLTTTPEFFAPEEWHIDEIRPGQSITLQQRPLNIPSNILFELTEEMRLEVTLTLYSSDAPDIVYLRKEISITVLPANFWGGETRQPDLLAAFVKPNGIYVESLVRQVTEVLEKNGYERSADGYQSNTREKPYLMAAALWNVIFS